MTKLRTFGAQVVEYMLVLLFIYGGFNAAAEPAVITDRPGLGALVGRAAIIVYAVVFFGLGLSLLLAKILRWRRIHGWALQGMFLVCIYVVILNSLLYGFEWGIWLTVLAGISSLVLWIRWRYKVIFNKLD